MLLPIKDLRVKIYADGADLKGALEMARLPFVKGLTTNPSLMAKAGIKDYEAFARELIRLVPDKPISFEIFADPHFASMIVQGQKIASWGPNVNVKVPVTNTRGEFTGPVISALAGYGVQVNVTAVFTVEQVQEIAEALDPNVPAIISVFAGRIADTGRDPIPQMAGCLYALEKKNLPKVELLWASPREVLNIFQANEIGCHIITCSNDIIAKLNLIGKDLTEYSRETVAMFRSAAVDSGYSI